MQLPNPSPEEVALWLKQMDRTGVHEEGWIAMNRRFNGITRAMRPFINGQYATDAEREAAFDGLTLALLAVSHAQDLQEIAKLFDTVGVTEPLATLTEPETQTPAT